MPYAFGMTVFLAAIAVVFITFGYLLINARSLMRLFKPVAEDEIALGSGRRGASQRAILINLVLHFAAWAAAGFAWLYLLADVRATAPDVTPIEEANLVSGQGETGR